MKQGTNEWLHKEWHISRRLERSAAGRLLLRLRLGRNLRRFRLTGSKCAQLGGCARCGSWRACEREYIRLMMTGGLRA